MISNIKYISLLIFFALLIILVYLISHKMLNVFKVGSDSMAPELRKNSIVFVLPQKEYIMGDIISYKYKNNPAYLITHRVILLNDSGSLITQGDNNIFSDNLPVTQREIIGKVVYSLYFDDRLLLIAYILFYYLSGVFIGAFLHSF